MKQKLFTLLILSLLALGQVWGAEPTIIWSEDWTGASANDTPTSGVNGANSSNASYTLTNGSGSKPGTTKVYNESLAGGTAPELMIGKAGTGTGAAGGSWAVSLSNLQGCSGTFTLKFKVNQAIRITSNVGTVQAYPAGQTSFPKTTTSITISSVPLGTSTITITFTAPSTSNIRIDEVSLEGTGSGNTCV